jgi:excisionase family DNA binding protein
VVADERQWKGGGKMKFYTTDEVGSILGIGRLTVLRFIKEKHLGAYLIGHNYRISEADLQGFIKASKVTKEA